MQTPQTPQTEVKSKTLETSQRDKDKDTEEDMIYLTTFKKGHLLNKFHFKEPHGLETAINKAKDYCDRHHLRHIHTVPFLINLEEDISDWGSDYIEVS